MADDKMAIGGMICVFLLLALTGDKSHELKHKLREKDKKNDLRDRN